MKPFSFAGERCDDGEASTKRSKSENTSGQSNESNVKEETETPVAEHFYSPLSNFITLICIKNNKVDKWDYPLYISGFCNITLYKGSAVINGYSMLVNKPTPLTAPSWTPSAQVHVNKSHKIERNKTISAVTASMKKNEIMTRFPDLRSGISPHESKGGDIEWCFYDAYDCILYVEGIPTDDQEWLVSADDQSVYSVQKFINRTPYDTASIATYKYSSDSDIFLRPIESALLERSPSRLSYFGLCPVVYDSSWIESSDIIAKAAKSKSSPRTIICGAKGVGKSTCLRYNVNKLLSSNKFVCVIDCDVGQPELSPPGMVSMHILSKPILAPSYLNIIEPYVSYFYGDVTPRNDPTFLIRIFSQLYDCYENVLAEYQHSGEIEPFNSSNVNRNTWKDSAASNVYAALLEDGEQRDGKDKRNLPLLVNCDGFIRYMGEEILSAIVHTVQPSHLMHLVTEKDRNLPAVEALRTQGACKVFELQPGSFAASNIASADLRILRLVSYFLRDNSALKNHTKAAVGGTCDSTDTSSSIYIRTGTLVDSSGFISCELARSPCLQLPFHAIRIRSRSQEVRPSLVLAALNASIVGLIGSTSSISSSAMNGGVMSRLHHRPSNTTFALDCIGTFNDVTPCHGLAIIRSIDIPGAVALAICPEAVASETISRGRQSGYSYGEDKLLLARSCIALPMPFLFGNNMPYMPYLSAELAGEGAAAMRSRSNVKRRGGAN